jgi:glyoxylase-like metal-dependent hydrolase (beta-lactamase superfamily II)
VEAVVSPEWNVEVLVPTHRIVLALMGDEVVEVRGSSTAGTFGAYRGLPGAVHGMIAWPNTVLLTGGSGPVVIDPGYMTQGDMLVGALAARGLTPDDVHTVLATHLHSDHVSALPQLGDVELYVHEAELETPHARAGRGFRDRAEVRPLTGGAGPVLPGVRFIHTPGHTDGHVAFLIDTGRGVVAVVGDTTGPDPAWFERTELPDDHPRRDDHLAAFRAIRDERPALVIPGHNPPVPLVEGASG